MTARTPKKRTAIKRKPPGKKRYTMSAAALAQRRAAQPAACKAGNLTSTGPTTPQGKAITSRNAWKHGRYSAVHRSSFGLGAASLSKMFGKPCVTTCPFHPDNPERQESPCSLVVDGLTHTGGDCLDKTVYVEAFSALISALESGDMEGMNGVLAANQAANLQLLNQLRHEIAERGIIMSIPAINKDGEIIKDPETGNTVPAKIFNNPALGAYIGMLETLKLNLPEMMATPKSRKEAGTAEENANAVQTFLGSLMQRANTATPTRLTSNRPVNHDGT